MKKRPEADPIDPLRQVLTQWTVSRPLPPRFQEQVWRRISAAEVPPHPSALARVSQFLGTLLPRPGFAMGYLAATLALGAVAGSLMARRQTVHLETALSTRYVQTVNPFQNSALQP